MFPVHEPGIPLLSNLFANYYFEPLVHNNFLREHHAMLFQSSLFVPTNRFSRLDFFQPPLTAPGSPRMKERTRITPSGKNCAIQGVGLI